MLLAQKFFWIYFGVILTCSIGLAVVVKRFAEGFAAQGKKPYVYGTVSSLLASAAAWGSTYITNHLFSVYWIIAGIYLLFGIIHQAMVQKKYFYSRGQSKSKVLLAEILFGFAIILFTIVAFSTLQYFLKDKTFLFYPMIMSSLAFFIPLLFMHTFDAAYNIPEAIFKTWEYPLSSPIDVPDEDPREKIVVMGFSIAKKETDSRKTFFRAKAPEGMRLGELFYHFINDYNDEQSETPIAFADKGHEPYTWWFRIKPKWYQFQRILDPDISIRENKIKENSVIICERL